MILSFSYWALSFGKRCVLPFWRARTFLCLYYAFEPYRDQTTVISRRTVRAREPGVDCEVY